MPDALSKTIPIWICVLNRLLFPERPEAHELRTPEEVVGRSEHSQIEERIPRFVTEVRGLRLDVQSLRAVLRHTPMRPVWVTPGCDIDELVVDVEGFHPVVLCTASSHDSVVGGMASGDYVQGAADDHETWALGLDAATFWKHSERLLKSSEGDLPVLIEQLVSEMTSDAELKKPVLIRPTNNIWISNNAVAETAFSDHDIVIQCGSTSSTAIATVMKDRYYFLECSRTAKLGSRQLRDRLPKVDDLWPKLKASTTILVACPTGQDLAVGTALAMICRCFAPDGEIITSEKEAEERTPNKTEIKHRLSWIMVSMPEAAPSRATLQSVKAYLMG